MCASEIFLRAKAATAFSAS